MKITKIIFFLITGLLLFGSVNSYAETIYTKEGRAIVAKSLSRNENTIWYEVEMSGGSGKIGIDISSVSEILNDDGTISPCSPTFTGAEEPIRPEQALEAEEIAVERMPEAVELIKEASRKIEVRDGKIQIPFPAAAGSALTPGQMAEAEKLKSAIRQQIDLDKLYPKLKGLFFTILPLFLILTLAVYIYFSICLQIIAGKTDTPNGWLAWVPFINLFLMANISRKPRSWMFIIAGLFLLNFIPILGIIGVLGLSVVTVILWCNIAKVRDRPYWYGILMSIPIVQLIVLGKLTFSDQISTGKID